MEETLQQKIKSVISKTGMNYKELAKKLGVSKDNFYKWKDSSNPRDPRQYQQVIKALDELLDTAEANSVVSEAYPKYITQTSTSKPHAKNLLVSISLTSDGDGSLLYPDQNAIPGSIITINNQPTLIAWRNDSPLIGEVDGLIPINGESMFPRYKSGSLIAIKRLKFIRIVAAGYDYYIVDKNGKGFLRKIKASSESDSVTLSSENEADFPTITRKWEDILAIFSIEAVVTKQST